MYHDLIETSLSSIHSLATVSYVVVEPRPRRYKCGLTAPCPPKHLAFRLVSGAANVIGPKICLEDKMWDSKLSSSSLFVYVFVSLLSHPLFLFLSGFYMLFFFPLLAVITRPASLSGELNASIVSLCLSPTSFVFVWSRSFCICCCFSSFKQCVFVTVYAILMCLARKYINLFDLDLQVTEQCEEQCWPRT